MALKSKPIFRKAIYPFYDSETACIIIIIMLLVLLFGITGITIARENVQYNGYIWVPALIVILSSVVLISASIRFIKHCLARISK